MNRVYTTFNSIINTLDVWAGLGGGLYPSARGKTLSSYRPTTLPGGRYWATTNTLPSLVMALPIPNSLEPFHAIWVKWPAWESNLYKMHIYSFVSRNMFSVLLLQNWILHWILTQSNLYHCRSRVFWSHICWVRCTIGQMLPCLSKKSEYIIWSEKLSLIDFRNSVQPINFT